MAARLSIISVGCMAITNSLCVVAIAFAIGLNAGASSVIGNVIGEGNERLCKIISVLSYVQGTLIGSLIGLTMYFYSNEIAALYTKSGDTLKLLSSVLKSASLAIFLITQALLL